MRFLYVIFGVLLIVFAWAGKSATWAAIILTAVGVIQIVVGLSQKHAAATAPPPPPPAQPPADKKKAPPKGKPKATFCGECGAKLEENATFCVKCGKKLGK